MHCWVLLRSPSLIQKNTNHLQDYDPRHILHATFNELCSKS
jgi:hypothetical protein